MVTASTLDETLERGWRGANEEQSNTEGVGVLLGTLEGSREARGRQQSRPLCGIAKGVSSYLFTLLPFYPLALLPSCPFTLLPSCPLTLYPFTLLPSYPPPPSYFHAPTQGSLT